MISGANEKELDLATARTDILLMCGTEQLKIVDEYYENQITNLQQKIDKAIDMLDLIIPELWNISNVMTYKIKEVKRTLGDKE